MKLSLSFARGPVFASASEGAALFASAHEGAVLFARAPRGSLPRFRALRSRLLLVGALASSLAISVLAPPSEARADQPESAASAEPAAYRDTIREALSEYRARNFPEARALFAEAHALYPNARTLRGLGMTSFELRSYRESIAYLTQALDSKEKPLDGALRSETERLIARAERFVGKLNLSVTPAEATITVDGEAVKHQAGVELVLEVGEHALEFTAEGYHTETRSLHVKGREAETWSIVLQAIPAPAPVVAAVAPSPEEVAQKAQESAGPRYYNPQSDSSHRKDERPLYKNPWLWTGVGAVVVTAIVVGVAVGASKTELGATRTSDNNPRGGVFSALGSAP